MHRILRHGSPIHGLPEEYSPAFPRSGMKFRHTSKALCCQVWLSQIWHRTLIPFNGQFWQAATHYYHILPLPGAPLNDSFAQSKHIVFLPECFESVSASTHWESSFRHETFRCRRGSSCSYYATIWIYAWSVCAGHHFSAINVILCVNVSFGGRCPSHAYRRCTARGDKFPHLTGFWLRCMFRPLHFPDPKIASVVQAP